MATPHSTREDRLGVASQSRSPLKFFALVFALSVPFWLIGAATDIQLTADLPISALIFFVPAIAAAILVFREHGTTGVRALLERTLDYRRIRDKRWYLAIVVLPVGVYALTYVLMRNLGLPLPALQFPVIAALGALAAFFIAAQFEELGWTGYATDPLLARWSAFQTGILLGLVMVAFHLVPLLQHGRPLGWIAWWSLSTVSMRMLQLWIYNNTHRSVFAVVVFHAMTNLCNIGPLTDFGPAGFPLEAQLISALVLAFAAAIVVFAWGPRTLARPR